MIGDGKPENEYIIVGDKLWKEKALLKLSQDIETPSPIKQTKDLLRQKIYRSAVYNINIIILTVKPPWQLL